MEQQLKEMEIRPNKMAFQLAVGFSVYTVVLIFLFKLLGIDIQEQNVPVATKVMSAVLSYLPYVLVILYAQIKHRTELGGYITFGRAFSTGFRVSATAGLFIGLLMILYYKVLDPASLDHILEIAMEKAAETAGDTAKAERSVKAMAPYMPIMIGFGAAISYTIYGLIISIIGAAVNKRIAPIKFD
ncbi:Protein of unknown function [Pedobacter westerhofensis]|uniref:DUF4199 domain-containing protein n=1 Tax=Pedobacter westerhofensis TaxID=425512 RepID=A0A521FPI7_9SPHI|nr:DUF4199 domain-containing protein [Pedobacter westerhofensis]SMO98036.1 Protein of unknown function [Pedobacter westerhofensis]